MFVLRRGLAFVLGQDNTQEALQAELEASAVPVSKEECRVCSDPCDEGHEAYPKFDVDMESHMLGSVKPYRRQVVISTGQSDWEREVTNAHGTLAAYMSQVETRPSKARPRRLSVSHTTALSTPLPGSPPLDSTLLHQKERNDISSSPPPASSSPPRSSRLCTPTAAGVFNALDGKTISILNGSHSTISEDPDLETVLVFPDYKMVAEVPPSLDGARNLWEHLESELVAEKKLFHTWVIPYSCVILLCSHKKRDKRCSIAAVKLEDEFTRNLESKGWTVDTQVEHPMDTPLEDFADSEEERQAKVLKQLQELSDTKRALIIKNSHIGGHRYAGNAIIYTPQGAGVWYGRVSTHEVHAIVSNTIEAGLVLPKLLRGGVNISRPGCSSLHDW